MARRLGVCAVIVGIAVLTLPSRAADQPKAAAAAKAPALTSAQAAKLATLQRLSPPDAKYKLAKGVLPAFRPTTVKKEISCGVLLYPPNPNPAAVSQQLFWVNNTGQSIPAGAHVEWKVEGVPASCCQGVTGATNSVWPPNPPSPVYFQSGAPELIPPQPWTRPCKAWVIIP